jgi:hypothetical protein
MTPNVPGPVATEGWIWRSLHGRIDVPMPEAVVIAIAVAAVVVLALLALRIESFRRNRRFAKKISPYERCRSPGSGQVMDPDDVPRHR